MLSASSAPSSSPPPGLDSTARIYLFADWGRRHSITNLPVESKRERLWDFIITYHMLTINTCSFFIWPVSPDWNRMCPLTQSSHLILSFLCLWLLHFSFFFSASFSGPVNPQSTCVSRLEGLYWFQKLWDHTLCLRSLCLHLIPCKPLWSQREKKHPANVSLAYIRRLSVIQPCWVYVLTIQLFQVCVCESARG